MDVWVTGLVPLLGVILGGALQYLFSRRADDRNRFTDSRNDSYADYLSGAAAMASVGESEGHRRIVEAKNRIMVHGSDQLIKKIARLEIAGDLSTAEGQKAYLEVIGQMRLENGRPFRGSVVGDARFVLFGASPGRSAKA